jgi:hypothetical protein
VCEIAWVRSTVEFVEKLLGRKRTLGLWMQAGPIRLRLDLRLEPRLQSTRSVPLGVLKCRLRLGMIAVSASVDVAVRTAREGLGLG